MHTHSLPLSSWTDRSIALRALVRSVYRTTFFFLEAGGGGGNGSGRGSGGDGAPESAAAFSPQQVYAAFRGYGFDKAAADAIATSGSGVAVQVPSIAASWMGAVVGAG
jgi:hypothetical protein